MPEPVATEITEAEIRERIESGLINPNPRRSKYNTHWFKDVQTGQCNIQQLALLCYGGKELLFGGRPGGGKSAGLVMWACQYLDVPGSATLLLRRTWPQLSKAGGLIDIARSWLAPWKDCWNEQKRLFTMPGGGTLQFGHCEHEGDKYNYQGDEYQRIGFDELTQFTDTIYDYILTRLRRREGLDVPLQVRSASNPGNLGHQWVKERFILSGNPQCAFIPSSLADNPFIDRTSYQVQLEAIRDPVLRKQMLEGDWDAEGSGGWFEKDWFEKVVLLPKTEFQVRSWDIGGGIKRADGRDSDPSVGTLWTRSKEGIFYVKDQIYFRATPGETENRIERAMITDEAEMKTLTIEEKPPGEAGIAREETRHKRFAGHWYRLQGSQKSKEERALAMSSSAQVGQIKFWAKRGQTWIDPCLQEIVLFGTHGVPDNRVDSMSLGYNALAFHRGTVIVKSGMLDPREIERSLLHNRMGVDSLGRKRR